MTEPFTEKASPKTKQIPKRTIIITFERQLQPQPPKGSHPYWCYINTLIFYDGKMKEVWRQEIPEASNFFHEGFFNWLDVPRYYIRGCKVKRTRDWGWILQFEMTHEEAAKIYGVLFKDHPEIATAYDKNQGQTFQNIAKEVVG